jgi:hypothetical protein
MRTVTLLIVLMLAGDVAGAVTLAYTATGQQHFSQTARLHQPVPARILPVHRSETPVRPLLGPARKVSVGRPLVIEPYNPIPGCRDQLAPRTPDTAACPGLGR